MPRPRKRKHRDNDHMWHSGDAAHEEADGAASLFNDFPSNASVGTRTTVGNSSARISSSHYGGYGYGQGQGQGQGRVAGGVVNHTFLSLQAYEADVRRGPKAAASAYALDWQNPNNTLIAWHPYSETTSASAAAQPVSASSTGKLSSSYATTTSIRDDDDEFDVVPSSRTAAIRKDSGTGHGVLMDRFDVRLFLDALSKQGTVTPIIEEEGSAPESPTGWSDLPSDEEDTFLLSPEEVEEHRRERRRREIEQGREKRIKAMQEAEGNPGAEDRDDDDDEQGQKGEKEVDVWGGSDEEPDEAQLELMRRTAQHLSTSNNSVHLEMRILANHGNDARFAFLKGRWSRRWRLVKAKLAEEQTQARSPTTIDASKPALGGLADYGDSDPEDDSDLH